MTGPLLAFERRIPFAAGLARRWIRDLERDIDAYGREIFVESRRDHDSKPLIWYSKSTRTDNYFRHERDSWAPPAPTSASGQVPR